jgi:AcrR family transcriptional regulator
MAPDPQSVPRRLPRGAHSLDPELVAASQRARLLEAIGRAVAERGYAATTIDHVVRGAGVSKKTFYEHFRDKEDCFLAAFDAADEQLFEHVRAAREGVEDWLGRIRAGVRAYLRWLSGDPALARVFLIEVAAAGPRAAEHRERARTRYAELMVRRRDAGSAPVPPQVCEAIVGGVGDIVQRRIRERGAEQLMDLEAVIVYLEVVVLAGPEEAARAAADA